MSAVDMFNNWFEGLPELEQDLVLEYAQALKAQRDGRMEADFGGVPAGPPPQRGFRKQGGYYAGPAPRVCGACGRPL